jgi:hypothetical protein
MSDLAEFVKQLSSELPPALVQAVQDCADARRGISSGDIGDDPETLHNLLVMNRRQIERIEEIVGQLVILKSRTEQTVATRKGLYIDAYNRAMTKPSVGFGSDYQGAKEKDAIAASGAVEEAMDLRKAEKTHRDIYSAWEYCKGVLQGARDCQRDLDFRMRAFSLQGRLES